MLITDPSHDAKRDDGQRDDVGHGLGCSARTCTASSWRCRTGQIPVPRRPITNRSFADGSVAIGCKVSMYAEGLSLNILFDSSQICTFTPYLYRAFNAFDLVERFGQLWDRSVVPRHTQRLSNKVASIYTRACRSKPYNGRTADIVCTMGLDVFLRREPPVPDWLSWRSCTLMSAHRSTA